MRKRIKRAIFAGSSSQQRRAEFRQELLDNHNNNQATFMLINQTVSLKPKTELQLFEERLKASIAEFKRNRL